MRRFRAEWACVTLAALCLCTTRPAVADDGARLLDVVVNGAEQHRVVTVTGDGPSLAMARDDAEALRLAAENGSSPFIRLSDIPHLTASVDEAGQLLNLQADPQAFQGTALSPVTSGHPGRSPVEPAAFLNYDLLAENDSGSHARSLGGIIETGAATPYGLADNTMTLAATGHAVTRLDTNYTYDLPDTLQRASLGDGISRVSAAGAPIRFAGLQFGREFSLQPGFVAFPSPTLQGQAALPSTVQVYVNNALRYQSEVAPGPFTIDRLPTVTGAGETTLVVRDPLGRETVTTGAFYASSALLSAGLWDYSSAAGLERENYGVQSADYRTPFASQLVRYGFSDEVTGEAEFNSSGPMQTAAGDFTFLVPYIGQAQLGGAVSNGVAHSTGSLLDAGLTRVGRVFSFSADIRHAIGGFAEFGQTAGPNRGMSQFDASTGISFGEAGSLTLSLTGYERPHERSTDVASLTYGVQVTEQAFLSLSVARISSMRQSTTSSLAFTMPLGGNSLAAASVESRGGAISSTASYAIQPENQRGFGVAATAAQGRFATDSASLSWDGNEGSVLGQVGHTSSGTAARLSATGGIAAIGDDLYASRKLDDSFALVSVPDRPDVRVYRDNLEVARTDEDGNALISGLQQYQTNRLRLEVADIPIGTALTGDALEVVPSHRSAAMAKFDVQSGSSLTAYLVQADHTPVPAGAAVTGQGVGDANFTGFEGAIFLVSAVTGSTITAAWEGHSCQAKLPQLAPQDTAVTVECYPEVRGQMSDVR